MQKFPNSLNITEIKKVPFSGMTIPEIADELDAFSPGEKIPAYRSKQIFLQIKNGARNFEEMTCLPKKLIKTLEERSVICGSRPGKKYFGRDGTIKLVLELQDGVLIETVLLDSSSGNKPKPDAVKKPHYTACLSTQAGCPMGCVFCKTGSMGFIRNLEPSEIVEQYLFLNDELKKKSKEYRISNVVVMGMGEPMLNLNALRKALKILCDPAGFSVSKRKITVSTAGVNNGITDMAKNGPETELAVSIASAREELRKRLMPGTITYPLPQLNEALSRYQEKQKRRITIETILLGGINTGPEDARALIDFCRNLDVTVNLIPWNPVKELSFEGEKLRQPAPEEVKKFSAMLEEGGITVTQRYRRGRGVSGACGQLGTQ
ncbi:MAG: 23S rRNA (adenine(2503)-C(2))-methyltransferase RlmN [Treponema sp.]|nr:23S rRNA (adenine(2503)-C(2))-methyltransferase RlmN [Treponema sp.]